MPLLVTSWIRLIYGVLINKSIDYLLIVESEA